MQINKCHVTILAKISLVQGSKMKKALIFSQRSALQAVQFVEYLVSPRECRR